MAASIARRCGFFSLDKKQFIPKLFTLNFYSTEIKANVNNSNYVTPLEKHLQRTVSERLIPKTKEEIERLGSQPIIQPKDPRILHVALLGLPNSGKSTLTNKLIGWRVCAVSAKPHTTRHKSKAIFVEGNTQIVFVDTPGLVSLGEKNRFNLNESMVNDPEQTVKEADLAIVLIDASNKWTRLKLDPKILRLLKMYKTEKSVLVLNKVDILKKKHILLHITASLTKGQVDGQPIMKKNSLLVENKPLSGNALIKRTWRNLNKNQDENFESENEEEEELEPGGWPHFDRVFMVSAETNDGIDELKNYIVGCAKPGLWEHPAQMVTDQSPAELALLAVKEKLLDHLPQEIPYNTKLKIEMWEVDGNGVLRIVILIICPRPHTMKLVLGHKGKKISQIANEAQQELLNTFRCELSLKLVVKHENQA